VVAVLLLTVVAATALVAAAALRPDALGPFALAAYVVAVGEVMALTSVLSPFHAVTRGGLAVGETLLLAAALGAWWLRGRPLPSPDGARSAARGIARDPVVVALATIVAVALAYELLLVALAPPSNWDSLTYHLARAAAWFRHGGVYWIPNAPTDRVNEFQPGAEQLVLYLFAATGKGAMWALPQFAAEIAVIAGIYVAARRLGYTAPASFGAGLLFATLSLVALESTTGQNDLVAASLALAAAALLLRGSPTDCIVAGVAAGVGVGVKLTVAIAIPVLVVIAAAAGRRALVRFAVSGACAFVVLGSWSYVMNVVQTGHVLGHGESRVEHSAHPEFPGSVSTGYRMLYRFFDLSGFPGWLLWVCAAAAVIGVVVVLLRAGRLDPEPSTYVLAACVALALLAPVLVLPAAAVAHGIARLVHLPVDGASTTSGPFSWKVNRGANEDFSAFGPLGLGILVTSVVAAVLAWRRGRQLERLALAAALPLFVVVLALSAKYNPWLSRFLIVPVALTMPLLASWFRRREVAVAVVLVAATALVLAHVRNQVKPIEGASTLPWAQTRAEAVGQPWRKGVAEGVAGLDRLIPSSACIGALVDSDDPTYLLYGQTLRRRIVYLRVPDEERQADDAALTTIVVKTTDYQDAQKRMRAAGWRLRPLSGYFTLAYRPSRTDAAPCSAPNGTASG